MATNGGQINTGRDIRRCNPLMPARDVVARIATWASRERQLASGRLMQSSRTMSQISIMPSWCSCPRPVEGTLMPTRAAPAVITRAKTNRSPEPSPERNSRSTSTADIRAGSRARCTRTSWASQSMIEVCSSTVMEHAAGRWSCNDAGVSGGVLPASAISSEGPPLLVGLMGCKCRSEVSGVGVAYRSW